jgi:hypothetical protein
MINTNDIGTQMVDTLTGDTVTVIALEQWKGGLAVCVRNPNTPNPAGIPGLENFWLDSRHLAPLTSDS